jgi:hypothetical protein
MNTRVAGPIVELAFQNDVLWTRWISEGVTRPDTFPNKNGSVSTQIWRIHPEGEQTPNHVPSMISFRGAVIDATESDTPYRFVPESSAESDKWWTWEMRIFPVDNFPDGIDNLVGQ